MTLDEFAFSCRDDERFMIGLGVNAVIQICFVKGQSVRTDAFPKSLKAGIVKRLLALRQAMRDDSEVTS